MRIGVDAGGTFTDFIVAHDDGRLETFKLRSDPASPARVILAGIERAATGARGKVDVVHGSTVATNALLERKGARTAVVTTAGFEDIIHIGRQNRAELYNLAPNARRSLVELTFGVPERTYFDGTMGRRPSLSDLAALRRKLERARVESIAICFLHSYANAENEQTVAAALAGLPYICCSHEVCPEIREYERTSTTAINAYVGPLMDRYLGELENQRRCRISVMQSNGGFMRAADARRQAVRTVLSGPAGGVIAAVAMARLAGYPRVLGFDMGGTSTDMSLADGAPREAAEASIDGFPVRVPMLDIHTVGAGGGSIARVDEGGLLRVGPESAGANPGPACYGVGEKPTVTDAHVVLGRIAADQLVGGALPISPERAGAAVDTLAAALHLDRAAAAAGILRVANANMERAIRVVSVERGHDPRDFALLAFGGCGGLHACEMAAGLNIQTVLVPALAGALSALGMLLADDTRDYAATALGHRDIERLYRDLERRARRDLKGAGLHRTADLRYAGQSYELNVPWNEADPGAPFHREHQRIYGFSNKARPTEIVTLRVRARRPVTKPNLVRAAQKVPRVRTARRIWIGGRWLMARVATRDHARGSGPALIVDYGATTLIPPGWRYRLDRYGTLIVQHRQ